MAARARRRAGRLGGQRIDDVGHAQQTVQEFQQSPSAEEALFLMASSYERLGLTELRDDTARILKANFPNATIDADLSGRRRSPWWQPW